TSRTQSIIERLTRHTLLTYTTLFRSVHAREARHRDDVHREPGRPRRVASRRTPQHEAVLRRDDRQPAGQCAGHPRYLRHRARERSEEHTSELQSRENLVCRLLLEKKK